MFLGYSVVYSCDLSINPRPLIHETRFTTFKGGSGGLIDPSKLRSDQNFFFPLPFASEAGSIDGGKGNATDTLG
jgi:hypothetical protein